MKSLTELRSEYTALSDQMRGVVARAKRENRDLTAAENESFAAIRQKLSDLETAIQNRAVMSGMEAAEFYREIVKSEPDNLFAGKSQQRAQAAAFNRYAGEAVRHMVQNGISNVSDLGELRSILSSNSAGTISETVSDTDYIAALTAYMPLTAHGLILDGNTDNYTKFPVQSGNLIPNIIGEASAIDAGGLTIGSQPVDLKKFAVIQKMSLETLEDYPPVVSHVATSAAVGFSTRLTRYVFDQVNSASGVQAVDASGLAASAFNWNSIADGMALLTAADVNPARAAFCCSPKYGAHFAKLRGTTNDHYLQRPAPLADMPFEVTSAILETYNSNTTTLAFLGDWSSTRLIVKGIGASLINAGTRFRNDGNMAVVGPGQHPVNDLYIGTGEVGVLFYVRAAVIVHRPDNVVVWQNLILPT